MHTNVMPLNDKALRGTDLFESWLLHYVVILDGRLYLLGVCLAIGGKLYLFTRCPRSGAIGVILFNAHAVCVVDAEDDAYVVEGKLGSIRLFGGFCGRDSGIGPAQRAKTTIWN